MTADAWYRFAEWCFHDFTVLVNVQLFMDGLAEFVFELVFSWYGLSLVHITRSELVSASLQLIAGN